MKEQTKNRLSMVIAALSILISLWSVWISVRTNIAIIELAKANK